MRIMQPLDKQRSNTAENTLREFVQVAEASLHPDGFQALRASETALDAIGTSLRDFVRVWEGQIDDLLAIQSKPGDAVPKSQELKNHMERWGRYRREIQIGVSSISASSDAAAVNPVGATRTKIVTDGIRSRGSIWRRLFR